MFVKLWRNRLGNFGMMTALLAMPLMLAAGLAVDFTNLSRLKSNLQNANDAAALMAAEYYNRTGELPDTEDVKKRLEVNVNRPADIGEFRLDNDNLVLSSTSSASLIFGSFLSKGISQVGVLSAVEVHNDERLDVVLALDNTGSMDAEGKIVALKSAAIDFVHTLLKLNTNGREIVRIGIVPFSNYVNVGMNNRYANWMWVPEDQTVTEQTPAGTGQECLAYTTDNNDCHTSNTYNDGVLTGTSTSCKTSCTGGYKTVSYPAGTRTWSVTWHGCVGSRGPYPYNITDEYRGRPFIGLPQMSNISVAGFPSVTCPTPLTPLTADEDRLKSAIAAMTATGNTYIAPGVMWGLRVISTGVPFTEGAVSNGSSSKRQQIMVLMSDGDNTKSPQIGTNLTVPPEIATAAGFSSLPDPYNEGTDEAVADKMTGEACQVAKDAKVTMYSISFGSDVSAAGKALLKGCADEGKFYDSSQVAEISSTFQEIANGIESVRLTQ